METSVLEVLVVAAAIAGIVCSIPTIEHYYRRAARAIRRRRHP